MIDLIKLAKNPWILKASQSSLYQILKLPGTCQAFNHFQQELPVSKQRLIHAAFAKLFRQRKALHHLPNWQGRFLEAHFSIPLRGPELWLDWDTALSINGHDTEVKLTYAYLLKKRRPGLFFDVGANYGTHSLLLSLLGVRVIAFEPNPGCHPYFWHLMNHHHCLPVLVKKGVGEAEGKCSLAYDPQETWSGKIMTDTNHQTNTQSVEVEMTTLDEYWQTTGLLPELIKIDTEGFELNVLKGSHKLLQQQQTLVIFESLHTDQQFPEPHNEHTRKAIFSFFSALQYSIFNLPWQGESASKALNHAAFESAPGTNFIAVPASI